MAYHLPPDPTHLHDFLSYRAEERPDALCWTYGDRTWTWAEAWEGARRTAGALAAAGLSRGDSVAFVDKNNPAILQTVIGGSLIGVATAIVNWRLAGDELDYTINDSRAKIVFVSHELLEQFDVIRDGLVGVEQVIVVGGADDEFEAWQSAGQPLDPDPAVTPDDVAVIMYSSGTTGRPKGVQLTQHNLLRHTICALGNIDYGDGDMMLIAMPMFHVGGTSYAMFGLATGTPGHIIREVAPPLLAGAMAAGVTHAFLVPAVVAGLLQAGPDAMKLGRPRG